MADVKKSVKKKSAKSDAKKIAPVKAEVTKAAVEPTVNSTPVVANQVTQTNTVTPATPVQVENNIEAIISLIVSILGLCAGFIPCIGLLFPVAGLILGIMGINKAKKLNGNGQVMAIIGTVISAIILLLTLCATIFYTISAMLESSGSGYYY